MIYVNIFLWTLLRTNKSQMIWVIKLPNRYLISFWIHRCAFLQILIHSRSSEYLNELLNCCLKDKKKISISNCVRKTITDVALFYVQCQMLLQRIFFCKGLSHFGDGTYLIGNVKKIIFILHLYCSLIFHFYSRQTYFSCMSFYFESLIFLLTIFKRTTT